MKDKICCILNYAPHYRQSIYRLMDKELNCDFYFGSKLQTNIKKIDYKQLSNAKELESVWFFKKVYWMSGLITLIFTPYKKYLITGQINCISNWIFLPLARVLGKEVYLWNHGWYGKESLWQKIIKKIFYWPVSGFFLYGEYARKLMIAEGYDPQKLHVVYNSLNYDKSLELRRKLIKTDIYKKHFSNDYSVILFSGRLQAIKRLDMLLTILKEQKEKGINYNMVLIGDGTDKDRLAKLVAEFELKSQVWIYGSCYDEEKLSELIYNADVCVSPGNVGLTAIHALSYGTPVITHNEFKNQGPEFEAIQTGVTGDFFEKDNLESLNSKIENWMLINPHKSKELINACYKVIDEKYNPFYQVEVIKQVLTKS